MPINDLQPGEAILDMADVNNGEQVAFVLMTEYGFVNTCIPKCEEIFFLLEYVLSKVGIETVYTDSPITLPNFPVIREKLPISIGGKIEKELHAYKRKFN
jgi:hypothetical protein